MRTHKVFGPQGHITVYDVSERTGRWRKRFAQANDVVLDWAVIALQAIALGDSAYRVNAMYVEYENVANPNDPVSVPSVDLTQGLDYYQGLAGDRDYLRVQLAAMPLLSVGTGYEAYFDGTGVRFNQASFQAQTSGTAGVRGEPFSNADNSKVIGVGLVATPSWADASQDVLFGRAYFDQANQVVKQPSYQVAISWRQLFRLPGV